MPRAKDLDTIAPDDMVSAIPSVSVPKLKKHKKARSHSVETQRDASLPLNPSSPLKIAPLPSRSADLKYRQKVYELIKDKTAWPLSAFLARPKVFNFDGQNEDEEILLVLRRHWFTNLHWIFLTIVMLVGPMFLKYVPLLSSFSAKYQFVFILFWYLLTFAITFEHFLSWYFNVFIITEERVIDIDFYNLLDKKYSEAELAMIQDVTSKQGGVSQTVFDYGDVLIQTAAEIPVIKIDQIPNPNLIVQILQQMRGEERQEELEGRQK
ncbi:MAG: PH domain-containing protein [Candidatus Shapirobacteria bacterium]